eukprot:CAMPEP_0172298716 /NCGR_PEP_ID=MMETSP1058-20130122/1242_1 /TAXON_ID=83371 /ORGANISM="Detonula confervacea, Strain CCMP 353" /LENGTH=179 /DNA_ID=CAMNT_0013008003 /DNA_START=52 /DNA_END=591 /DNA_ORIENTATION=+
MANPLRSSQPALFAAIILLILPSAIFGWIPRILTSCSRTRGSDVGQRVSLSASNVNDDNREIDDNSDQPDDIDREAEILPLFAELNALSRLEAMFDMDLDFYIDGTDEKSQQLLEGGERVVLGDWMDWDEGLCTGESCGDENDQCDIPEEYKVASPKVDVMSFLGIQRAEPLHVRRDWD